MRPRFTRRWLLIGAGVLAAAVLLVLVTRESPLEVETAPATVGRLEVVLEEDGRTRAIDRYVVTAPVAGRLQRIDLSEGEGVTAGEVVARIEPAQLDAPTRAQLEAQIGAGAARVLAAEATVDQAAAAAEQARRELERRQRLAAEGIGTREQLEQFALALELREQELEAARATVRAAGADVDAVRAVLRGADGEGAAVLVRSPGAGRVLRVNEVSGRVVAPGEPLLEVGDPDALEVAVDVLTPEAVRVRPGMPATLTGWGGEPLNASVRNVEPSAFTRLSALGVEEQRVWVILELGQRPPALGDGFRVDARITLWAEDDVLTVPASALFRGAAGWRVFVVEAGRAWLRDVEVGERGEARTQIRAGLAAGDRVVLFPPDELEDGARVREAEGGA